MIPYFAPRCPTVSPDTCTGERMRVGWIVFLVSCWFGAAAFAEPPTSADKAAEMWRPYRKPGTAVPNRDSQTAPPSKSSASQQATPDELPRRAVTDPFADDLSDEDFGPPVTTGDSNNPASLDDSKIALAGHAQPQTPQEPAPFQFPPGLNVPTVPSPAGDAPSIARASFDPVLLGPIEGEYIEGEYVEGEYVEGDYVGAEYGGEYIESGGELVGGCPNCGGNCGAAGINFCQATWTFNAEYLLWSISGFDVPALVTNSPAGTPRSQAGILGEPETRILFGDQTLVDGSRSGGRFSLSRVLEPSGMKTVELSYFFLGQTNDTFSASSDGSGILARPFFSVEPGATGPNAELVAFPGVLEGNISVTASSEMQGGGIVAYQVIDRSDCRQIRLFAGYNYHELEESLEIRDFKRTLDSSLGLAVGTTIAEQDQFSTDNQLNSFVLGADLKARHRRVSVGLMMKLGLGNTNTTATLAGRTTTTVPLAGGDDINSVNTGLLVLDTNRGIYEGNEFTMMPQLGIDLGFQINRGWSAHVGYDFIYWSRVLRPGDQVDTNLNLSQLAAGGLNGIPAPEMPWKVSDLRIHAIDFGLQLAY
ncbi:BBP7 family outer membrane beta-barrel protein [Rosistilla oblonga]|uniref:BBP7 family outer membrane beta-barrel protein n=1 Tax=Rosistilla oblonga TaxID=2527990 RepID=UPI003A9702B9